MTAQEEQARFVELGGDGHAADQGLISAAEWDRFCDQHPAATAFHLSGWRDVLGDMTTVSPRFLAAVNPESCAVEAIAAAYLARNLIGSAALATLPGGIIAKKPEQARALLKHLMSVANGCKARTLLLRGGEPDSIPCQVAVTRGQRVHSWINLEAGADAVWGRFAKKHRYHIRLGERSGFLGRMEPRIPEAFHPMFVSHQHRLGTPAFGAEYFRALNRHLLERVKFAGVWKGARLVAGGVILECGRHWENVYLAAEEDAVAHHAIYVLYWTFIRAAAEAGRVSIDLGRSSIGSGNHAFKRKWATSDQIVDYRTIGLGERKLARWAMDQAQVQPSSAFYHMFSAVWRRIPLGAAAALGPLLRRRMPIG